jgi:hypothetical protein
MNKSDRIENRARIECQTNKDPQMSDIWGVVCANKALIKHVIENDLPHIWRVILIILSYLVVATAGFFLKGLL